MSNPLATGKGIRALVNRPDAPSADAMAKFHGEVARLAAITMDWDETREQQIERIANFLNIRPLDVKRSFRQQGL